MNKRQTILKYLQNPVWLPGLWHNDELIDNFNPRRSKKILVFKYKKDALRLLVGWQEVSGPYYNNSKYNYKTYKDFEVRAVLFNKEKHSF